jgi:hypothetical protein
MASSTGVEAGSTNPTTYSNILSHLSTEPGGNFEAGNI